MIKRYAVFAGDVYYPEGGFEDYFASYDTLDEALALNPLTFETVFDPKIMPDEVNEEYNTWAHIVDIQTGEIVAVYGTSVIENARDGQTRTMAHTWKTPHETQEKAKVYRVIKTEAQVLTNDPVSEWIGIGKYERRKQVKKDYWLRRGVAIVVNGAHKRRDDA